MDVVGAEPQHFVCQLVPRELCPDPDVSVAQRLGQHPAVQLFRRENEVKCGFAAPHDVVVPVTSPGSVRPAFPHTPGTRLERAVELPRCRQVAAGFGCHAVGSNFPLIGADVPASRARPRARLDTGREPRCVASNNLVAEDDVRAAVRAPVRGGDVLETNLAGELPSIANLARCVHPRNASLLVAVEAQAVVERRAAGLGRAVEWAQVARIAPLANPVRPRLARAAVAHRIHCRSFQASLRDARNRHRRKTVHLEHVVSLVLPVAPLLCPRYTRPRRDDLEARLRRRPGARAHCRARALEREERRIPSQELLLADATVPHRLVDARLERDPHHVVQRFHHRRGLSRRDGADSDLGEARVSQDHHPAGGEGRHRCIPGELANAHHHLLGERHAFARRAGEARHAPQLRGLEEGHCVGPLRHCRLRHQEAAVRQGRHSRRVPGVIRRGPVRGDDRVDRVVVEVHHAHPVRVRY
mmetsp:Transcript_47575/g.113274  ORF Transcript_47575/g.113274 Transcript_47575/m.113274 type:complete len:471 (+) Transcript_47575:815-2227(+)